MKISFVHIQNFRKLKDCRIDFSEKETVFVGANNSGKTTAMDALILFLKSKNKFTTRDFTLSNWKGINLIGEGWAKETDLTKIDLNLEKWEENIPILDIWINVNSTELHYVNHLIPTLDWTGGLLGIRLKYEPNNIEELHKEYLSKINNAKSVMGDISIKEKFSLWPKDMWDFLEKDLNTYFSVKTYLLNPDLKDSPQKLTSFDIPLDGDTFSGLIKIDIINAQRGFSDINSETSENISTTKNLSSQLRNYYDKHLNPTINPTKDDIEALKAMQNAKEIFDKNLKDSFKDSLKELEFLNYPGFGNPKINLSSKINTADSLNHDSSVQYFLDEKISELSLPEKYNGLGYQNLISMIFKLIRFRDEWMLVGKSFDNTSSKKSQNEYEPLHLILIEEPEAHLHAQVQQVFIKEAYKVLRNHKNLKDNKFSTQLVISTHSNHIAHEIDFTCLRYFKREIGLNGNINTSKVVNLSKTFGTDNETTRFAIRYLKTTHCDLFFADAVIMVEGPAERMLVPYFIRHYSKLSNCYISLLEIGGSHAHTLRPLIENLGIVSLIITDLDSINPNENNKKVKPEKAKGYASGNDTLKSWLPKNSDLDTLLGYKESDKEDKIMPIKIAYQISLKINDTQKDVEIYPYTFEDSLVMENRDVFQNLTKGTGLLKKMIDASKDLNVDSSALAMYDAITEKGAKKAEFALELFYFKEPNLLKTPLYIKQGLEWLEKKLVFQKDCLTDNSTL